MKDESLIALEICRRLDESAGRLPFRVCERLAASRRAAVAAAMRATAQPPASAVVASRPAASASTAVGTGAVPARAHATGLRGLAAGRSGFGLRRFTGLAMATVPVVLLSAGALSLLPDDAPQPAVSPVADEVADAAIVSDDDVPVSAWADRGFGVYLKNVSFSEDGNAPARLAR